MRNRDDVNGKQVAAGCGTFMLMFIVVCIVGESSGITAFIGTIAIILLFLLGVWITGALSD